MAKCDRLGGWPLFRHSCKQHWCPHRSLHLDPAIMGKSLLFSSCRHHVHEIIIGSIFDTFFASTGPDINLFLRFTVHWPLLNHSCYLTLDLKEEFDMTKAERKWFFGAQTHTVEFLSRKLSSAEHPRDDYKEFLDLCLIMLGRVPATEVRFRAQEHAIVHDGWERVSIA